MQTNTQEITTAQRQDRGSHVHFTLLLLSLGFPLSPEQMAGEKLDNWRFYSNESIRDNALNAQCVNPIYSSIN